MRSPGLALEATALTVGWRLPLRASHDSGEASTRPLLRVTLTGADGVSGRGEAAPLQSYDGVSLDRVATALRRYGPVLGDLGPGGAGDIAAILARCRGEDPLPQALAAIDLALWDLAGRRSGRPVWQLLGARAPAAIPINAVIGAVDSAAAAAEAAAAVRAGYRTVKVKVGVGDDPLRVRAVRGAVGPGIGLRIDANGAWASPTAALTALAALAPLGVELCEEPVHGAAAIAAVATASPVAIAVDESAGEARVLEERICAAVCLKIAAAGGIGGVVDTARRARALGYDVFLASTLDGPLGIAAALHAAAVIAPDRACGLSTLERFDRAAPLEVRNGLLESPPGPGLGTGLLDWYEPS